MRHSALCLVLAPALLFGCAAPTPDRDGALHVLAAETFLADIAQNVAGDRLVVESLIAPGVDPHEFQSTPQDAIRLAQTQLLIVNGLGYESWLERSLAAAEDVQIVEASRWPYPRPRMAIPTCG